MDADSGCQAGRVDAATFRLNPDTEVSARLVMDEDFRPIVLVDLVEPKHVPLRFALPSPLARRFIHAVSEALPELAENGDDI